MSDLKHKQLNKDRDLNTQIINAFEQLANETTMASLCSQEDYSAFLIIKMLSLKSQLELVIQTYDAIFYQKKLQKVATLIIMIWERQQN